VEFALLRRSLNAQIGRTGLAAQYVMKLWAAAAAAAAAAWTVKLAWSVDALPVAVRSAAILGAFTIVYGGATTLLKVPLAGQVAHRMLARIRRR
jgi:putative peptidoglycan lipid II flippase